MNNFLGGWYLSVPTPEERNFKQINYYRTPLSQHCLGCSPPPQKERNRKCIRPSQFHGKILPDLRSADTLNTV